MPILKSPLLTLSCDNCADDKGWDGCLPLPAPWLLVHQHSTHYTFCSWLCLSEYSRHEEMGRDYQEIPWLDPGTVKLDMRAAPDGTVKVNIQDNKEKENE